MAESREVVITFKLEGAEEVLATLLAMREALERVTPLALSKAVSSAINEAAEGKNPGGDK